MNNTVKNNFRAGMDEKSQLTQEYSRTTQRDWDFRGPATSTNRFGNLETSCGDTACYNLQSEGEFNQNNSKFYNLPFGVIRIIQNMKGHVTDCFEMSLIRFRDENIIESNPCNAVFTKNLQTAQCWLTAFSRRDNFRTSIKFNRRLTFHLIVKLNGKTAVEFQPSNFSLYNKELYVFNFASKDETNKFLEALDKAKNQIWNIQPGNPSAHFSKSQDEVSPRYRSNLRDFKMAGSSRNDESLPGMDPYSSLPNARQQNSNISVGPKSHCSLQEMLWPQHGGLRGKDNSLGELSGAGTQSDFSYVKFIENMSVSILCDNEYLDLGTGELTVVVHQNYFDEVTFVGEKSEVIFKHYVYKWNILERGKTDSAQFCKWNAAVCFGGSNNDIPVYRDFKIESTFKSTISKFFCAMSEARKKGEDLTVSLKY